MTPSRKIDSLSSRKKISEIDNPPPIPTDPIALPASLAPPDHSSKETVKRVWKSSLIFLYLCLLVCGSFIFAESKIISAYDKLLDLSRSITNEKSLLELSIEQNDLEGSVKSADKLEKDIYSLKLSLEGWGQDILLFQLSGAKKSSTTENEILADSVYRLFNLSKAVRSNLVGIRNQDLFSGSNYLINLTALKNNLIKFSHSTKTEIKKTENSISDKSSPNGLFIFSKLDQLNNMANGLLAFADEDLPWLSGDDGKDKNILIIFQNNAELRGGSGGSLGSFGVVKLSQGKLKEIDFGTNIYKIDAAFLEKEKIPAPSELEAFDNGFWTMKNAGFAVDGKEALDKIAWFYEQETGNSLDGVITFDTTAFTSLLEITGPIDMPAYNLKIGPDNFVSATEEEVQINYFESEVNKKENEPKKILADMMPLFLDKLFNCLGNENDSLKVISAVAKSLKQKDILLSFNKDSLQKKLETWNLSGEVTPTTGDYLYINNSNLAGAKTDQNIGETVRLSVLIDANGTVTDKIYLTRKHQGKNEWPDGLDRNYIRILVPEGSGIINFDPILGNFQRYYDRGYRNGVPYWTDEEADKSTINFWMSTMPGETSQANIEYKPNYQISIGDSFNYQILFQKQPGALPDSVELEIFFPKGFAPTNVINYDPINKKILLRFKLDEDKKIVINFKKK